MVHRESILSRRVLRIASLTLPHSEQKVYANKIKPIRKNGHLLLVTLLLANMIVNESLPVISDPVLGGGFQSVVVSTVLIVMYVFTLVLNLVSGPIFLALSVHNPAGRGLYWSQSPPELPPGGMTCLTRCDTFLVLVTRS